METRVERKHREIVSDVFEGSTTDDLTMNVYDLVVEADVSGGSITITLPPVAEARGKIYSIELLDADSGECTVTDAGDDSKWTDVVLGDDDDYLILFSNGTRWFELSEMSDDGER